MFVEPGACQPLPARAMQRITFFFGAQADLSSNHCLKYIGDRGIGGRGAEGTGIKIAHAAR